MRALTWESLRFVDVRFVPIADKVQRSKVADYSMISSAVASNA
jgi:hypothetical protein